MQLKNLAKNSGYDNIIRYLGIAVFKTKKGLWNKVKIRSLQKLLYIYGRKQYIFPQHSAMINLSRQCHTDRVTPLDLPAHVYFDGECLCHYVLHEAQHCLPKTEQELPVINLDIVSKYWYVIYSKLHLFKERSIHKHPANTHTSTLCLTICDASLKTYSKVHASRIPLSLKCKIHVHIYWNLLTLSIISMTKGFEIRYRQLTLNIISSETDP